MRQFYWTSASIAIVCVAVISFITGYTYREDQIPAVLPHSDIEDPVSGDIFNNEVVSATTPNQETTPNPTLPENTEIHAWTGYIRNLKNQTPNKTLSVEAPDGEINTQRTKTFTLTDTTTYSEPTTTIDATGQLITNSLTLTLTDLTDGDIVTVYTLENLRTTDQSTATTVQRLKHYDDTIEQ